MELIFEASKQDKRGYSLAKYDDKKYTLDNKFLRKYLPKLPELSEPEVMRHFVNLSSLNFNVDKGFYPLGSCTMKYNPKINEYLSRMENFASLHPLQPEETTQGALQLLYELEQLLCEISGMDAVSLQPVAGAHSELTGLLIVKKYFDKIGKRRKKILIPDSAHGTNPASTALTGFTPCQIKSNNMGLIDIDELEKTADEDTACIMLTIPNTLGLFEKDIEKIADIVHKKGGLLYLDGANLNAFLGIVKPKDIGIDIVHFNLHKTFSTPHGTGGPGGGGIGVISKFEPFLPIPRIVKKDNRFHFSYEHPDSIGKVHSFYGNFGVCIKAYIYIRMLGPEGLRKVSENAIINANYLLAKLKEQYHLPFKSFCMHEFVISGDNQLKFGVKTLDIAKRLLDYGFHPPTIYFPLIVHEALMIEPTETESKDTLAQFATALINIAKEAETNPELLKSAPHNTPVRRLDEVLAARQLDVKYEGRK